MLNEKRLKDIFETLVKIDSPSGEEKEVCSWLKKELQALGCEVAEDNAAELLGTSSNNLIAKFKGKKDLPPMMLSGHMDTVEPGRGVEVLFENGIFRSKGDTILGSDDKSALAIILEVLNILKETGAEHCPLEIVFTVFEEGGLKGAKVLDISMVESKFGYILDSTDTDGIVVKAPCCNQMKFKILGKPAHAGAAPENGINAIMIASKALANIKSGRIDEETTCNIGLINGGTATNIVADEVVIEAEARSQDPAKLKKVTDDLVKAFQDAVNEAKKESIDENLPLLEMEIDEDFPNINLSSDEKAVVLGQSAAKNLGYELKGKVVGGGSDANVLFHKGIKAGVIGTGMKDIHTTKENIALSDMVKCGEFLLEVIKLYSKQ